MNTHEKAIRSAVFDVDDAFRGYWVDADEPVEILGLPSRFSSVLRSLQGKQSVRVGLEYKSVQLTHGAKRTKFYFIKLNGQPPNRFM
jgi:hypothetical protein